MMTERTRTLLFGLFVTSGREALTASEVVALAAPLGLSATNVRSHLTRLVSRGDLVRRGPTRLARYSPAPRKAKAAAGIRFRLQLDALEEWDDRWVLLSFRPAESRAERAAAARRLRFDGFRPRGPWTWARPCWPRRWALERAAVHREATDGIAVCGELLGVDAIDEARRLFRTPDLSRAAARAAETLMRHRRKARSAEQAFALRMRLGGLVARTIATDPVLPPEIWGGADPMRELARIHRETDALLAARAAPVLERVVGPARSRVAPSPLPHLV
jgi:DNA-binding transcriptional regulator PaaX